MTLHQVVKREGDVERVPRGQTPVVELDLEPGAEILSIEIRPHVFDDANRKTRDWHWTAYVVTPLPAVKAAA